jgi:MipA family protein
MPARALRTRHVSFRSVVRSSERPMYFTSPTDPGDQTMKTFVYLQCAGKQATALVAAGVMSATVQAQTAAPAADAKAEEPAFTVSVGATYGTTSLTGVRSKATWEPLLDLEYTNGRFYASTGRGVGYNLVDSEQFTFGVGLAYTPARKEKDDLRRRGLGDIKGSGLVLLTADWSPLEGLIHIYGNASLATRRENGAFYTLGTTIGFPLYGSLSGFVDLSTTFGDKKYMAGRYGVTPANAAPSGYAVFTPGAGIANAAVSVGVQYEFSKTWSMGATAGTTQLLGDAKRSPVTGRKREPDAALFVSYSF